MPTNSKPGLSPLERELLLELDSACRQLEMTDVLLRDASESRAWIDVADACLTRAAIGRRAIARAEALAKPLDGAETP